MHEEAVVSAYDGARPAAVSMGLLRQRDAVAPRHAPCSMARTLALVLAGGKGTRLGALTAHRAKPAVPIGGKHRIIDFTLSNCRNSRVPHVGVLTQYQARSLGPTLDAWGAGASRHGQSLRALQAHGDTTYAGTADAVHQNRDVIRSLAPAHVLVLAADHVYRMDYATMLADHQRHDAQLTIGCIEVPLAEATSFGVMEVDGDDRVAGFVEKPATPKALPGRNDVALASMGIYIFDTYFLLKALADDAEDPTSAHDFGKDIIPRALANGARVYAHHLSDMSRLQLAYWRDVGTVDAYWRTSFELTDRSASPDFDDSAWPIQPTIHVARCGVGARLAAVSRVDRRNVIFTGAQIGSDALVDDSILLPGARVGRGCVLRKVIVEEGCVIGDGMRIGVDPEQDRRRFEVSPQGVVLVGRSALAE